MKFSEKTGAFPENSPDTFLLYIILVGITRFLQKFCRFYKKADADFCFLHRFFEIAFKHGKRFIPLGDLSQKQIQMQIEFVSAVRPDR